MKPPLSLTEETLWMLAHPQFTERPATIDEFLGVKYLNIEEKVRPGIKLALKDIFGHGVPDGDRISKVEAAMVTGAIGIGKTTLASIALPYMVHWCLCLKDPQDFYGLLPGSRIAFMQMSTSETHAREVIFGDIKARIDASAWFKNWPYDKKYTKQIRFDKDIWILPGDSAETTFEGYNILGGILDEADSHKVTQEKDYAEQGYNCVDEETQILSRSGWKYWYEVIEGEEVLTLNHDTGSAEWQSAEKIKSWSVSDHDMTEWDGNEFSAVTTLDHRWPVVNGKGKRQWRTTQTMQFLDKVTKFAPVIDLPMETKYSDAFVELVAWIYTEGHVGARTGNVCTLYQKDNSKNQARIRAALTGVFGPAVEKFGYSRGTVGWKETLNRGLRQYDISSAAWELIRDVFIEKVPSYDFLNKLTQAQLELFVQVSLLADNCGEGKLAQKNHAATEAFAYAAILSGRGVSIREHITPGRDYDMLLCRLLKLPYHRPVYASKRENARFRIFNKKYTGTIWCPQTENASWLARRRGSVYYTGNTIESRIASRFVDNTNPEREGHRGLIIVIGQMKKDTGFAAKKYRELKEDDHAHVVRMTIWESFGWDKYTDAKTGKRVSFWYDVRRREILPDWVGQQFSGEKAQVMEIPKAFYRQFKLNPEKALKDLAGIPPTAEDPFFSMPYKLEEAETRWVTNHPEVSELEPLVSDNCSQPAIAEWVGQREYTDARKRVAHIDIGYSEKGDAAGIAVGHVRELVEADEGDLRPYIVIDLLIRFKAPPGGEVQLSDLRRVIYMLRDRGMRIEKVTMDGFQSTDTRQQFIKRKLRIAYVSLDKDKLGYEDLREAVNEDRIEWPTYLTYLSPGSSERVNILQQELLALSDTGRKIDHPKDGSKDLADAVAGVTTTLMGDKSFRKGLSSTTNREGSENTGIKTMEELLQQFDRSQPAGPFGNPVSPMSGGATTGSNVLGIHVPDRLRPR